MSVEASEHNALGESDTATSLSDVTIARTPAVAKSVENAGVKPTGSNAPADPPQPSLSASSKAGQVRPAHNSFAPQHTTIPRSGGHPLPTSHTVLPIHTRDAAVDAGYAYAYSPPSMAQPGGSPIDARQQVPSIAYPYPAFTHSQYHSHYQPGLLFPPQSPQTMLGFPLAYRQHNPHAYMLPQSLQPTMVIPYPVSQPQPAHYPMINPSTQGSSFSSSEQSRPILSSTSMHTSSPLSAVSSSELALESSRLPLGPPMKPRQSGHAVWVGNLPHGTLITELKDHFSRGATDEIESVRLLPQSNCAFVNYTTQVACGAAARRFDQSYFHGHRIVCRMRSSSVAAVAGQRPSSSSSLPSPVEADIPKRSPEDTAEPRYFILKSLTSEDLEASVRTGTWVTQPHNETMLNEAFEGCDNVYLIFSGNGSGEFFGYARMSSTIASVPAVSGAPEPATANDEEKGENQVLGPRVYSTAKTEWAPLGRIVDDPARDMIFWESIRTVSPRKETVGTLVVQSSAPSVGGEDSEDAGAGAQIGRPFQIQWLSTTSVPFHRARTLRNSWNSNRHVKIARDGTELDPTVGKALIALFSLNRAAK